MDTHHPLPPAVYIQFELGIYAAAIYVLVQLVRKQPAKVPIMLAAMVFAGALEVFDIRSTHSYHYDRFLLMWGTWPNWFPICIAVAWGLVLHSTMTAAEHLVGSRWMRPPIVAVLAVSVDMLLDPVVASSRLVAGPGMACDASYLGPGAAIGIGFWVWCVPQMETTLIWGIPYANFFAWGAVTLGFCGVAELLQWRFGKDASLLKQCLLAVVTGLLAYHAVDALLQTYSPLVMRGHIPEWALLSAMFVPGLVLMARAGTQRSGKPVLLTTWLFVASSLFFCYTAMIVLPDLRSRIDPVFAVYAVVAGAACGSLYYWVLVGRRPARAQAPVSVRP